MHKPVLEKEVFEYLDPGPDENFIDCTLGQGGHTVGLLERNGPGGKVLGIEIDPELYEKTKESIEKDFERLVPVNDSYADLKKITEEEGFGPVSGVLLDLGISSWHIEESGRGFSFQRSEPLSMRYDKKGDERVTAGDIVNKWPARAIEKVLEKYGEEEQAREIAEEIVRRRKRKKIRRGIELATLIEKVKKSRGRIHPATKSFQALRIAVNQELENLKAVLPQALEVLREGGRLAVISFHSLEDGIVKRFFQKEEGKRIKVLTKEPVRATKEEVEKNPGSRSARLRAAEKRK